jgi:hypothetical protein
MFFFEFLTIRLSAYSWANFASSWADRLLHAKDGEPPKTAKNRDFLCLS